MSKGTIFIGGTYGNGGGQGGDNAEKKHVVVGEAQLIGEWTEDGVTYDLYRKTINFGALTNAEQKSVSHGITDRYRFTRCYGMAISSSNNLPLPFSAVDAIYNIYLAVGNTKVTITPASDRTAFNAWVTLEYIKKKE